MEKASRGTFCSMRAASAAMRRRLEGMDIEGRFGLTGGECAILGFLLENSGRPLYQKDVEEEFRIRRSSATRALQGMEKKCLLYRESEAHDARLKRLVLTDKAICMGRDIGEMITLSEQRLLRGISREELNIFADICGRICRNAENANAEDTQ